MLLKSESPTHPALEPFLTVAVDVYTLRHVQVLINLLPQTFVEPLGCEQLGDKSIEDRLNQPDALGLSRM